MSVVWIEDAINNNYIQCYPREEFTNLKYEKESINSQVTSADWPRANRRVVLKGLKKYDVERFVSEVKMHSICHSSKNVVRFLGLTEGLKTPYIMVFDYDNQSDLRLFLQKYTDLDLPWQRKLKLFLDISKGLGYMHSLKIAHRNLHSKNIVVSQLHHCDKNEYTAKITDFGSAKIMGADGMDHSTKQHNDINGDTGQIVFTDPNYLNDRRCKKDLKSDIYSLGVIFWEISSHKIPFKNYMPDSRDDFRDLCLTLDIIGGLRERQVSTTPDRIIELYQNCWKHEETQRPNIQEVIETLETLGILFKAEDNNLHASTSQSNVYKSEEDVDYINKNVIKKDKDEVNTKFELSSDAQTSQSSIYKTKDETKCISKKDDGGIDIAKDEFEPSTSQSNIYKNKDDEIKYKSLTKKDKNEINTIKNEFELFNNASTPQSDINKSKDTKSEFKLSNNVLTLQSDIYKSEGNATKNELEQSNNASSQSSINKSVKYNQKDDENKFELFNKGQITDIEKFNYSHSHNNIITGVMSVNNSKDKVMIKKLHGDDIESYLRQLNIVFELNKQCDNITKFLGVFKDENNWFLITEFSHDGNLRDYLNNPEKNLAIKNDLLKKKIKIATDIVDGIRFLHKHNIIHENLHPKNILMFKEIAKISDLPLPYEKKSIYFDEHFFEKIGYLDPDSLLDENFERKKSMDIYSLGSLLWEIMSEKVPYSSYKNILELIEKIKEGHRERDINDVPVEYKKLYKECWKESSSARPDIEYVYGELKNILNEFVTQ